jgi:hypothetical protein
MSNTIDTLLTQLDQAISTADLTVRHRLSEQLQRLARSIATPRQLMTHYGYSYTEQVAAKVAADLQIFTILSENDGALGAGDIAAKCGADPVLIGMNNIFSLEILC